MAVFLEIKLRNGQRLKQIFSKMRLKSMGKISQMYGSTSCHGNHHVISLSTITCGKPQIDMLNKKRRKTQSTKVNSSRSIFLITLKRLVLQCEERILVKAARLLKAIYGMLGALQIYSCASVMNVGHTGRSTVD
ncbi:hypothetical protein OSTOST_17119 [Ostertagia ostertagi]